MTGGIFHHDRVSSLEIDPAPFLLARGGILLYILYVR
jgi:hypothetical protein